MDKKKKFILTTYKLVTSCEFVVATTFLWMGCC